MMLKQGDAMRQEPKVVGRVVGRWRSAWSPAMAAGLALVERALVGEAGSPVALLRTLRGLGDSWTDPVTPVLSLMALLAEALVGYLLLALALRWLCLLPGLVGRAANRTMALVTPTVVRRALDLLVGGTLLAQAALTVSPGTPPGHPPGVAQPAIVTSPISGGAGGSAALSDWGLVGVRSAHHRAVVKDLVVVSGPEVTSDLGVRDPALTLDPTETRPVPRRSAAPLPPWLGGGPSTMSRRPNDEASNGSIGKGSRESTGKASTRYTVAVGDTLWDIAAAHLAAPERTLAGINRYWRQVYQANRSVIGDDPDLIHPGTGLQIHPYLRERR
jgi:nucleoid-associated protein YgaU